MIDAYKSEELDQDKIIALNKKYQQFFIDFCTDSVLVSDKVEWQVRNHSCISCRLPNNLYCFIDLYDADRRFLSFTYNGSPIVTFGIYHKLVLPLYYAYIPIDPIKEITRPINQEEKDFDDVRLLFSFSSSKYVNPNYGANAVVGILEKCLSPLSKKFYLRKKIKEEQDWFAEVELAKQKQLRLKLNKERFDKFLNL